MPRHDAVARRVPACGSHRMPRAAVPQGRCLARGGPQRVRRPTPSPAQPSAGGLADHTPAASAHFSCHCPIESRIAPRSSTHLTQGHQLGQAVAGRATRHRIHRCDADDLIRATVWAPSGGATDDLDIAVACTTWRRRRQSISRASIAVGQGLFAVGGNRLGLGGQRSQIHRAATRQGECEY